MAEQPPDKRSAAMDAAVRALDLLDRSMSFDRVVPGMPVAALPG
jgi:hypothetical protein